MYIYIYICVCVYIYKDPTANIIINNERLNVFSLSLRLTQVCPLSLILFNTPTINK